MSAVSVTINGVIYDKQWRTARPVVLIGEAFLTGLEVGGGPSPPQAPVDPGYGISIERPAHPIAPGGGLPVDPGYGIPITGRPSHPIYYPGLRPEHPIVIPPPPEQPPTDPGTPKPPPADGGWGWHPEYGWGYFPGGGGKPQPPG